MFKGNNSIELNEATLIEALQYWFDNVMFKDNVSPSITSVKSNNNNGFTINTKQIKFEELVKQAGAK